MKGIRFIIFFAILFSLCYTPLSAQMPRPGSQDWWYTLEQGKQKFRQGNYGDALFTFEDARRQRRTMYERMERYLIDLLSIPEVRRLGDSLDWVERYIDECRYADAADALKELYYRIPKERFNNSASAALSALSSLKDYPEAEYWIGETFLAEGEMGLALSQFQKTLNMRHLLENPGFSTELMYKIAGIHRIRQEYNEMERILLSILAADSLWSDNKTETQENVQPVSFEQQALKRTLEKDGINRFITLYRYNNAECEQAHRLLGYYYYVSGRHNRAQNHLMFSFLIQNTVIINELIRRQYDFTFTNLEALAAEFTQNRLISDYIEKQEYYKTAYYLASSLYANGNASPARGIWNFLSVQTHSGEWRNRALSQLRSPRVEQAVEMP